MKRPLHRAPNEEGPSVPGTSLREITSTNSLHSPASWADVKRLVQPIRYVPASALWVVPVCRGRRDVFVSAAGAGKSSEALRVASCA